MSGCRFSNKSQIRRPKRCALNHALRIHAATFNLLDVVEFDSLKLSLLALQEEAMGLARGAAKIKASVQKWDELVQVAVRRKHVS